MLLVKDLSLLNGKKVSLEILPGHSYVLQGANGSGKTLLLRTLAGLYPSTYSTFLFKRKNFEEYRMDDFRSKVLYVSSATHMPGDLTAEEFLSAPLKLEIYRDHVPGFSPESYLSRWELKGKRLAHLSSGQKQLLTLLRTLTLKAELLLLDEPTSHLDKEKTLEVEELIKSWQAADPERTYLVVSHAELQAKRLGKILEFSDFVS